jgi:hypothetical protein
VFLGTRIGLFDREDVSFAMSSEHAHAHGHDEHHGHDHEHGADCCGHDEHKDKGGHSHEHGHVDISDEHSHGHDHAHTSTAAAGEKGSASDKAAATFKSKTDESQDLKGNQSYYYWHGDAERRRVTGEKPVPVPLPQKLASSEVTKKKFLKPIEKFSFLDDSNVIKIYIKLEGGFKDADMSNVIYARPPTHSILPDLTPSPPEPARARPSPPERGSHTSSPVNVNSFAYDSILDTHRSSWSLRRARSWRRSTRRNRSIASTSSASRGTWTRLSAPP